MSSAQPESCGCLLGINGQRYQPQTCGACGGSFKIDCSACQNVRYIRNQCPHQPGGGRSLQMSSYSGSGGSSGHGYHRGSRGGAPPHQRGWSQTTSR